jgi:hypothetical protein
LWVAGNFGKARGTNKGHGLLLNSGRNLLFDEIDQPLLNPSLCFEAQIPIDDVRGGCDVSLRNKVFTSFSCNPASDPNAIANTGQSFSSRSRSRSPRFGFKFSVRFPITA